jgi:hypothetical protein
MVCLPLLLDMEGMVHAREDRIIEKTMRNTHVALVNLAVSWQNCPALEQLTSAILGFFAPAACVLQNDVDAADACGSHDVVSVVFCP